MLKFKKTKINLSSMFNPIGFHEKHKKSRWYQALIVTIILFIIGIIWDIFRPNQLIIIQNQTIIGNQTIEQQVMIIDKKEPISKLEVSITKVFWGPRIYNSPEKKLITNYTPYTALWNDTCYLMFFTNFSKLGGRVLEKSPSIVFNFTKSESYYFKNCDWYYFYLKNIGLLPLTNTTITYKKGGIERNLVKEEKFYMKLLPNESVTFSVNSCTSLFDVYVWDNEEGLVDNVALIEVALFPCNNTIISENEK